MKKPIDPNLNDAFSLDGLDDIEVNDNKPSKVAEAKKDDADMLLRVKTYYAKGEEPPAPKPEKEEIPESERHYKLDDSEHHHRHSGEHHHSGGHHHHSSEHHHSSGSHHSSSHHSSHHHSSSHNHSKKKKKTSAAAKIAIIFLLLIVFIFVGIFGSFLYLEHKGKSDLTANTKQALLNEDFDEIIEYNGHTYKYNSSVIAIAFIGVDRNQLAQETVSGNAGQADADIVFAMDTKTGTAKVIAIPRDTMVDVNLYSESGVDLLRQEEMQLCLSYAYGNNPDASAKNVLTSIERILYNVPIEKYFVLDLDGIGPINDAVGGVTVESLYDFTSMDVSRGDTVTLKGDMAQIYVRQRDMNDINASLNRTQRQVQYIKAFAKQLVPAVTNDFGTVRRLYDQASAYSATNLDISNATYIASFLISKGVTDFETTTLQGEMTAATQPTGQVYAEFHLDEDATLQTVLDVFYTQID